MKKQIFLLSFLIISFSLYNCFAQNPQNDNSGLCLSVQAYTFKMFTFSEAMDKIKSLGIYYVEMYPDQKIGGSLEGTTNYLMDTETRGKLIAMIHAKGLRVVSYGVATAKNKDEWIKLFEFAKAIGIETIVAEPDSVQLNYIEPMCEKYNIKVALHNHPNPAIYGHEARYWNPGYTMDQIKKRNKYIGVCADLGHWIRSGLNPLESLKQCEGRIMDVHAKDLVPGKDGICGYHDVPWGTGISNFSGLMHELKRQGYKGCITIEYEYHWENSLPEVEESVEYFNRLVKWMNKE